jgi:hypothetical protein
MADPGLAKRIEGWRRRLRAKSNEELIECLNREVRNSGWVELRAYYLRELSDELNWRGFDQAAVDGSTAFPGNRPFVLIGK